MNDKQPKEKAVKVVKTVKNRKASSKPADARYLVEQRWVKNKHRRAERDTKRRTRKLNKLRRRGDAE